MHNALILLAEGFEELEAITVMDLLVRANIEVTSAGLEEGPVTAARQTVVVPNACLAEVMDTAFDLIVLPGGLPGADHLANDERVIQLIQHQAHQGKLVAAICAAPRVLVKAGLCRDKTICCYPGSLDHLDTEHIQITSNAVCTDLPIITSRGPGTAMDFALQLIALLEGEEKRENVESALVRDYEQA
ncbi:MAG: DJ-1/PfpI family protein [Agarilytica sp.]